VETNIVLVHTEEVGLNAEDFLAQLAEAGVLAVDFGEHVVRFTTHRHISDEDVKQTVQAVEAIISHAAKKCSQV
jgi:threonine aldolase